MFKTVLIESDRIGFIPLNPIGRNVFNLELKKMLWNEKRRVSLNKKRWFNLKGVGLALKEKV